MTIYILYGRGVYAMKTGLISKSVSVGKKAFACWPGAQSVAKEQPQEKTAARAEQNRSKKQ